MKTLSNFTRLTILQPGGIWRGPASLTSIVTLFLFSSFSLPPKEIKLQYMFKRGDVYEWSQTASQKITQVIPGLGADQISESSIRVLLKIKVTELVPSGARLELEYSKIYARIRLPMAEMTMNSEGDSTQSFTKVMRAMTGKKFNCVIAASGAIQSIENIENLWSGLNSIKEMNDAQLKLVRQSMDQSFGKAAFKSSLEAALPCYPENKVKSGSVWQNKTGLGLNFPIQIENRWTLDSFTETAIMTSGVGKVSTTDSTKAINLPSSMRATTSLKGTQISHITINRQTGWPQAGTVSGQTRGKIILLAGGMILEDMTVPTEIKSESSFQITKK